MADVSVQISKDLIQAVGSRERDAGNELVVMMNEIGQRVKRNVQDETPYITHNLQSHIMVDDEGCFNRRIYPDEGQAPYGIYVILPGVSRDYPGNPFMDRGWANSQGDIDAEVERFAKWVSDL